jgi:hypothetical protein
MWGCWVLYMSKFYANIKAPHHNVSVGQKAAQIPWPIGALKGLQFIERSHACLYWMRVASEHHREIVLLIYRKIYFTCNIYSATMNMMNSPSLSMTVTRLVWIAAIFDSFQSFYSGGVYCLHVVPRASLSTGMILSATVSEYSTPDSASLE